MKSIMKLTYLNKFDVETINIYKTSTFFLDLSNFLPFIIMLHK